MREKYESLSLATLKDLAKARGLKGISTLRKPELIERMLQEDEKESTGGEAEMKKTEILQEEPGRQENRVRENRTSYEVNERKTYQDKKLSGPELSGTKLSGQKLYRTDGICT